LADNLEKKAEMGQAKPRQTPGSGKGRAGVFVADSANVWFANVDECAMIRLFRSITLFQRHFPLEGFDD
jgi:hypothetical protein